MALCPRYPDCVIPMETSVVPATLPLLGSTAPLTFPGHSNGPKGWVVVPNTANQIPTERSDLWPLEENSLLYQKLCGAIFLILWRKAVI